MGQVQGNSQSPAAQMPPVAQTHSAPGPMLTRVLALWSSGSDVKMIQDLLNALGFGPLVVDGTYGLATAKAVTLFQQSLGLPADGIVGAHTMAALATAKPKPSVAPAQGQTKGLDVSHYQGFIDWHQVKAAGYDFALIKATEGTGYLDDQFHSNWAGAKDAGLLRGAYHYFHPNLDPVAQAQHFIANVPLDFDIPHTLDFETDDGLPKETIIEAAGKWLTYISLASHRTPLFYTYPDFITTTLGGSSAFLAYPLWIAEPGRASFSPIAPWPTWTFAQDSFHARVPGVPNETDTDVFNGTLDQLKALKDA